MNRNITRERRVQNQSGEAERSPLSTDFSLYIEGKHGNPVITPIGRWYCNRSGLV
ncbi:hypothetical protein [Paenibacillus sp. FSL K6-2393]|uniref:hypothetical protein n=1 Tax=Paenibacillus sp. FSL K6-2393 TaxID=2921475 RepID=UPI0030FBDE7E